MSSMPTSSAHSAPITCDVLVVGGGPAGSTISALLAEQGWNVHVLEKDRHPRFHIGESLLPHSLPMLKHLGVLPDIEKIGLPKYGAEVVSPYHGRSRMLYFSRALDGSQPFAYEVKRAEFDEILFKNATAKGAHMHEGVRAKHVEFRPGLTHLVQAEDRAGRSLTWEAKFVVDASGRDTFLSGQLGGKFRNSHHNSAAVFGHFEGVKRLPGMDEGNISIIWFDHGWWWIIPFKDGTTSVGAVCWPSYISTRKVPLEPFLWDTIALCPPVAERMASAKLIGRAYAAANYSYRRKTMRGDGYLMVGDAFAFIDPVFSSGVHLALNSATLGAKVVDAYLRKAPEHAAHLREFERSVRLGVKTYSWFIYHFTQPAFRALFMSQGSLFKMEEAVLSILAGDAFGKSPTRIPILLFKIAYYLVYLFNLRENWAAYRRRVRGVPETVTEVTDYAVNQPPVTSQTEKPRVRHSTAQHTFRPSHKVSDVGVRLAVTYHEASKLEPWLAANNRHPLAVISFGHPLPQTFPYPLLTLDFPQLDGPHILEVWSTDQPVRTRHDNGISITMSGDLLVGSISLDEKPGASLDVTTCTGYRHLLHHIRQMGHPHLWRVWNYFPRINDDRDGLERYRQFCVGRHQALAEAMPEFPTSLPAGTTVGTRSGPLQIFFLAGTRPATHLGNPRQMNAYEYPQDYGPRSPSFARASLCRTDHEAHLLIAGTASVVGHASQHLNLPEEQTRETIQNLVALLGHTEGMAQRHFTGPRSRASYKVYVRDAGYLSAVRNILRNSPLSTGQFLFLQGDLCRRELLVEIEGLITSD